MADEEKPSRTPFEPPPWEREAFEALAAKRAEQEAEAQAFAEAMVASIPVPESPEQEVAPAKVTADIVKPLTLEIASDALAAGGTAKPGKPAEPDSKLVQTMMLQLQREERSDSRTSKIVAWVASGVTVVLGAGMLISGLFVARNSGGKGAAVMGSAVLSVFGLIFICMAAWVWVSTTRVRGR